MSGAPIGHRDPHVYLPRGPLHENPTESHQMLYVWAVPAQAHLQDTLNLVVWQRGRVESYGSRFWGRTHTTQTWAAMVTSPVPGAGVEVPCSSSCNI